MKNFRTVSVPASDHASLADRLSSMSAEGWEVVTIVSAGGEVVAFLEREGEASASQPAAASVTTRVDPVAEAGGWAASTTASPVGSSATVSPVASPVPAASTAAPTQVMPAVEPVVQQNVQQQVQQQVQQPAQATIPATPAVPADWYKDPSGRFELRYWNGTKWTEHVARGGKQFVDPPVP
ncbi:MAG: DUF2510 domain-containing protein [Ilumatobacteraceae bacterium]